MRGIKRRQSFMYQDDEKLVTITEQGNYGLGIGNVTDEKEREELRRRLNEMQDQSRDNNRRK